MDALHALHNRTSVPKLTDPAPSQEALQNIYRAAFRAADHGMLKPWRFLIIRETARALELCGEPAQWLPRGSQIWAGPTSLFLAVI